MLAGDLEHPDTMADANLIEQHGGFAYVEAIGELSVIVGSLFDGPGQPAYLNASKQAQDVFFEHRPFQGVRLFARQFWGGDGASVIAAVGVKSGRPALLSIVAVGLALPGAAVLDYQAAENEALALAQRRCADM